MVQEINQTINLMINQTNIDGNNQDYYKRNIQ